ncbi:MAG: glutamate--cysteine ligase [Lentisphaeraceae bacterium]|nr:glutamate--cysteine ligase [Lentisphaeraceae bacterium]
MYNFNNLKQTVESLGESQLSENIPFLNRGLEKESLRQVQDGQISKTPHPHALGSALTNKYITTDYSEALLEYITPVFKETDSLLEFLENLHTFSLKNMPENEKIWCHSMPCILTKEEDIPIADYGSSNIGMMKHIYRHGLAWRYSRRMQTIAGIHFNFSLPDELWQFLKDKEASDLSLTDYKSKGYFNLIRNFKRHVWLLFYFTGSSPALCKSFLTGQKHQLESFDECTAYKPYATSLRMSDLGYTNKEQQHLTIRFNSLEEYVDDLGKAIKTPSEEFEKIGIKVDGEYRQLNSNILQIENEFYSIIRPKRTANSGEKPSCALSKRGVEYIEVRMLDLNPFIPIGISEKQIDFLDIFLLACVLAPSPEIHEEEKVIIEQNQTKSIIDGRNPDLKLKTPEGEIPFSKLAKEALDSLSSCATVLDKAFNTDKYSNSLSEHKEILKDSTLTPSGKVLHEMKERHSSYYPFAKTLSAQHNALLKSRVLPKELNDYLIASANESHELQKEIEQNDTISFEAFLDKYFNQ